MIFTRYFENVPKGRQRIYKASRGKELQEYTQHSYKAEKKLQLWETDESFKNLDIATVNLIQVKAKMSKEKIIKKFLEPKTDMQKRFTKC